MSEPIGKFTCQATTNGVDCETTFEVYEYMSPQKIGEWILAHSRYHAHGYDQES